MTEIEKLKLKEIEDSIAALDRIIASGVREVVEGSRTVKYATGDNILKARELLEKKRKELLDGPSPLMQVVSVQGEIK